MIVKCRDVIRPGAIVEDAVRSIDIVPMILDIAGIESEFDMEGISLLPLMNGDHRTGWEVEIFVDHVSATADFQLKGVIKDNRWKYILTEKSRLRNVIKDGPEELYNIEADPWELHDLAGEEKEILKKLRDRCRTYSEYCRNNAITSMPVEDLDSETLEQLKFLGYIR